mgnify:CR=1 FL=1
MAIRVELDRREIQALLRGEVLRKEGWSYSLRFPNIEVALGTATNECKPMPSDGMQIYASTQGSAVT